MGMPRGGSELEGSDAILLTKLIRRVVAGGIDYENEFAAITYIAVCSSMPLCRLESQ
jgi:hypothetical protein